jgi:hypothetical protein
MKYLCCFLFSAAAALASDIGDTYEKVIAEKGPPKSQMEAGAIRILSYPDATIKIKDNVVVSIKAVIAAPAQPTAVPRPAGQEVSPTERIAALKRKLKDALAKVDVIVNQPAPSVPRTPEMNITWWGNAWFHPGATTPDFNNVDVRKTQETAQYAKYQYVSSNFTPDIAFLGSEIEFNSMTKFFYVDRSVPKKKLTEDEMLEINRLYRIIGQCEIQLDILGAKEGPAQ